RCRQRGWTAGGHEGTGGRGVEGGSWVRRRSVDVDGRSVWAFVNRRSWVRVPPPAPIVAAGHVEVRHLCPTLAPVPVSHPNSGLRPPSDLHLASMEPRRIPARSWSEHLRLPTRAPEDPRAPAIPRKCSA